jgi:hypothetical protein
MACDISSLEMSPSCLSTVVLSCLQAFDRVSFCRQHLESNINFHLVRSSDNVGKEGSGRSVGNE